MVISEKHKNVLRKLGKRRVQILASTFFLEKDLVSKAQSLHLLPGLVTYLAAAALTLQDYSNIHSSLNFWFFILKSGRKAKVVNKANCIVMCLTVGALGFPQSGSLFIPPPPLPLYTRTFPLPLSSYRPRGLVRVAQTLEGLLSEE